jgi:undecaprenyl-diphosphatase
VPTVIIAVLLESLLPDSFSSMFLGYGFMITGILLYTMEMVSTNYANKTLETIKPKDAFLVGCVQGIATISGISRSGSTIAGGVFFGMDRKFLARFSFLMSIPIIVAAVALELLKGVKNGFGGIDALPLAFGMITAMVTGYVSIKFMLKIIKKANYKWFSLYLVLIAIATIITAIV